MRRSFVPTHSLHGQPVMLTGWQSFADAGSVEYVTDSPSMWESRWTPVMALVPFESPADVAAKVLGVPFATENTGGGCEALVGTLPNGVTVVITNSSLSTVAWGDSEVYVGGYLPGQWHDEDGTGQHDPVAEFVGTFEGITARSLEGMVRGVMVDATDAADTLAAVNTALATR